jgi:hypothetical protein
MFAALEPHLPAEKMAQIWHKWRRYGVGSHVTWWDQHRRAPGSVNDEAPGQRAFSGC